MAKFLVSVLFLGLIQFAVVAQSVDTTYLNRNMQKVPDKKNALYFRIIHYKNAAKTEGIEKTFLITGEKSSESSFMLIKTPEGERKQYVGLSNSWYKSGQMEMQRNFVAGKLEGKVTRWYENGQVYNVTNYAAGNKQGVAISYYPEGKVKRQEVFNENFLAAGKCFTKTGADTVYFPIEEMPGYPGGLLALNSFIRNNLKYDKEALKLGIQGLVVVQFVIDKTGSIQDVQLVKNLAPGLDVEAIRVVKKMPRNWQPARQEGKPVSFRYTLPIRFGLN